MSRRSDEHVNIWGKTVPARGNCKGPGVGRTCSVRGWKSCGLESEEVSKGCGVASDAGLHELDCGTWVRFQGNGRPCKSVTQGISTI